MLAALDEGKRQDAGRPLTSQEIQDHLVTMLIAGHATTAAALVWVWYLLDLHPDVRLEVESELASQLGGRLPTAADIPRLPLTRMVIDETLRLYPVVPVIYIALALFFVIDLGYLAPRTSGVGYLIVLTGLPAYLIWRKQAKAT